MAVLIYVRLLVHEEEAVLAFIELCESVCDVSLDHGYLANLKEVVVTLDYSSEACGEGGLHREYLRLIVSVICVG